jgi:hypothetical protein
MNCLLKLSLKTFHKWLRRVPIEWCFILRWSLCPISDRGRLFWLNDCRSYPQPLPLIDIFKQTSAACVNAHSSTLFTVSLTFKIISPVVGRALPVKLTSQSQSQSQTSSLPQCHRSGTRDQFSSFFYLFFYSYEFVNVGRTLWGEVESIVFSYCWASPAQSFSSLSPAGLMSIIYCLNSWDSPIWRARFLYLFPPSKRLAQLYFLKVLCKEPIRTSQETNYNPATKINRLMLLGKKLSLRTRRNINTLCGQNAEFCYVKALGIRSNNLGFKD